MNYVSIFHSETEKMPRGVQRISGITGSAIKDSVIKGSIFFGTPILCALAVMRRTFLLT